MFGRPDEIHLNNSNSSKNHNHNKTQQQQQLEQTRKFIIVQFIASVFPKQQHLSQEKCNKTHTHFPI